MKTHFLWAILLAISSSVIIVMNVLALMASRLSPARCAFDLMLVIVSALYIYTIYRRLPE